MLRRRDGETGPAVTNVELFFDLVYVFAVTQLSVYLRENLSGRGALEALVLFLAVWWAWNYTAWATNWIDPEHAAVRLLLLVLMLISLVMSAAIPGAFGGRGLSFAGAYVGLQVVRSACMVAAFRGERMSRNYAQLLAWSCIAGGVWIGGAFAHGDARLAVWIAAVAIDVAAPLHGFALPLLGRTPMRDWTLAGGHLAERNQLVLLIALGESILAVGATFAGLAWDGARVAALVVGFAATVALWWIYFVHRAEAASRLIAQSVDPARVGRAAYAYGHAVMVAGVIAVAVGIDLTIAEPHADAWPGAAAVVLGGPALYLLGNLLFTTTLHKGAALPRLAALGVLALLLALAPAVNRLVLAGAAAVVLVVLAAGDIWTRPNPASVIESHA